MYNVKCSGRSAKQNQQKENTKKVPSPDDVQDYLWKLLHWNFCHSEEILIVFVNLDEFARVALVNTNLMKTKGLIAQAQSSIDASIDKVWDAFTNPDTIKKYMFGTTVSTDWRKGSDITWKGEWNGKAYVDKGEIVQIKPKKFLEYTHFSPLTGEPDVPENYHTVSIKLAPQNGSTTVLLSQDNNKTEDARKHSENNWTMMLSELKKLLEGK